MYLGLVKYVENKGLICYCCISRESFFEHNPYFWLGMDYRPKSSGNIDIIQFIEPYNVEPYSFTFPYKKVVVKTFWINLIKRRWRKRYRAKKYYTSRRLLLREIGQLNHFINY